MRCYFTFDEVQGKKVLIPGCFGSMHREDLACCTCSDHPTTFYQFEKQLFNEKVAELNKEILDLRSMVEQMKKDNYQLMRFLNRKDKENGVRSEV